MATGTGAPGEPHGPGGDAGRVVGGEPWRMLQEWLPANDDPARPPMTLSTVTPDGRADARTLLLTEFDRDGFYFHTHAASRKVAQLAVNPAVALTLVWPELTRQLVVQGTAEVAQAGEIARAYRARSPYLQQLAWQNTPEFAQLPRAERLDRWRAFAGANPQGFEQPPTWVGYLVRPRRLTFWQGDTETASRRTEFTVAGTGWTLSHLPG